MFTCQIQQQGTCTYTDETVLIWTTQKTTPLFHSSRLYTRSHNNRLTWYTNGIKRNLHLRIILFQLILLTWVTIQLNFYAQSTAQDLGQNATVLINNKKRKREKEKGRARERVGKGGRGKSVRILLPWAWDANSESTLNVVDLG